MNRLEKELNTMKHKLTNSKTDPYDLPRIERRYIAFYQQAYRQNRQKAYKHLVWFEEYTYNVARMRGP